MKARKKIIYFRDSMKMVLDADKVVFVSGPVDESRLACWLSQGMRVIRWENVNCVKEDEVDDAE